MAQSSNISRRRQRLPISPSPRKKTMPQVQTNTDDVYQTGTATGINHHPRLINNVTKNNGNNNSTAKMDQLRAIVQEQRGE
jgi:hypothetical protein